MLNKICSSVDLKDFLSLKETGKQLSESWTSCSVHFNDSQFNVFNDNTSQIVGCQLILKRDSICLTIGAIDLNSEIQTLNIGYLNNNIQFPE